MLPTDPAKVTISYFESKYPHTASCKELAAQIIGLEEDKALVDGATFITKEYKYYKINNIKPFLTNAIKVKKDMIRLLKCGTPQEIKPDNVSQLDTFTQNLTTPQPQTPELKVPMSDKTKKLVFFGISAVVVGVFGYFLIKD